MILPKGAEGYDQNGVEYDMRHRSPSVRQYRCNVKPLDFISGMLSRVELSLVVRRALCLQIGFRDRRVSSPIRA